jgi:peptidoglycan LD-endopeptidase LytH
MRAPDASEVRELPLQTGPDYVDTVSTGGWLSRHLTEACHMYYSGPRRRSILAIAMAALTIGVGAGVFTHADAAPKGLIRLEASATSLKPAVRLRQSGSLLFPMNPLPKCAMSKTSFGQPRPPDRVHEGLDIMAGLGQEVYAADTGVLVIQTVNGTPSATLSGNAWRLRLSDGTYYFYGHLSAFAAGLTQGSSVIRGQLIGYVGDTGNPGPGNYHLHFEVHPQGGVAVDPFPLLTIPKTCQVYA